MQTATLQKLLPYVITGVALWIRWPVPEPLWMHIDEQILLYTPLGFWSGDLHPYRFNYPTLQLYLNSFLYYIYYLLSYSGPVEDFLAEVYFVDSQKLLALARGAGTIAAVCTVAVTMRIGQRLYGWLGGLIAGLFICFMPLHVRFSHLANTDIPATFWISLATLWALRIVQTGKAKDYILAGIFVGLAGSSKYPAALIAISVLVASLQRPMRDSLGKLAIAGLASIVTFAATSPYIWLDYPTFAQELTRMSNMHLIGQGQDDSMPSWWYFLRYNLRYGLGLIGVIAVFVALCRKPNSWRREELVVATGAMAFAAVLATAESGYMRYALPLAPLLAVFIVRPLLQLRGLYLAIGLGALLAEPVYASLQMRSLLSGPDTRARTQEWLAEHSPQTRRVLQMPQGAGQIRLLSATSLLISQTYFLQSFERADLARAYNKLSQSKNYPLLYMLWQTHQYQNFNAFHSGPDSMVVVAYDHPLSAISPSGQNEIDALKKQVHWQQAFSAGDTDNAVFEAVDWYFMPIGNWSAIVETGPSIHIGKLPFALPVPPTTQEYFSMRSQLLAADLAMQQQDWTAAINDYDRLLSSAFFLKELFSTEELVDLYRNAGIAYGKLGDMQAARANFTRALSLGPDEPEAEAIRQYLLKTTIGPNQ